MSVSVHLWSSKPGELKRFLESYYQKDVELGENVDGWIYVYREPLDAIDLMSAVVDNGHCYSISVSIQVNQHDIHEVVPDNINHIIKAILHHYGRDAICDMPPKNAS